MWSTILAIKYDDYTVTNERLNVLQNLIAEFQQSLAVEVNKTTSPIVQCSASNNVEWMYKRSVFITGSVAKEVCKLSHVLSMKNFLHRHLWNLGKFSCKAVEYGKLHEADALAAYLSLKQKEFGENYSISPGGLYVSSEFVGLGATPDAMANDCSQSNEDCRGCIEVKCPFILRTVKPEHVVTHLTKKQLQSFCCAIDNNNNMHLKENHSYYYQVQLQMGVTGCKWCDFVIWTPHGLHVERIYFNNAFWNDIATKLIQFHGRMLIPEYFEMRVPRGLLPLVL